MNYFSRLPKSDQSEWLSTILMSAIDLTVTQYGSFTPRTHGSQPCDNTPLMLFAKQLIPKMDNMDYIHLINYILYNVGGDMSLVDNRKMNAVMLAVGAGNWLFVEWAYQHVDQLAQQGFDWKQRNTGNRNVRCLTQQKNSHRDKSHDGKLG